MPSSKSRLVTLFFDIRHEDELRLRYHFNKTFVPTIRLNEQVKVVRFEFITEGLLAGKVLGKKAYEVRIPPTAENSILNSRIVLDKVIVNGKEYRVEWPVFHFMNPDKVTVKIKELRQRQRKEGWKGKAFKSVFWDWDGAITLRVVIETEDGKVGYYDILRIVFVYKGNASAALAFANERRREYKYWIKKLLNYIAAAYGNKVAELVKQYVHVYMNYKERDRDLKLRLLIAALKDELENNRKALNYITKVIDSVIRMRMEINELAKLMNRTTGARFLVLVDYRRAYNPILIDCDGELEYMLAPLRFYAEIKAPHAGQEDRWMDRFGNQYFMVVKKEKWEKELRRLGFEITEFVGSYAMDKKFRPIGKLRFLNHEIRVSGVPPKDLVVDTVDQTEISWLWKNVRIKRPKTKIKVLFARKVDKEYVVYVVEPLDRAGRCTIVNFDHRHEGKDRVIAHVPTDKVLVFIHKL